MEGVRLMGQAAQSLFDAGDSKDIATLVEKIAVVGTAGIAKEDYRPVTLTSMEQLATLTFNVIRSEDRDIRFAASELRKNVAFLSKLFLNVPDAPLASAHSTYLAPYFSLTTFTGLVPSLTALANAVVAAPLDNVSWSRKTGQGAKVYSTG